MKIRIAVDCMSGDLSLAVTVPAVVGFLKHQPHVELILVGKSDEIKNALSACAGSRAVQDSFVIHHATEIVTMDESPLAVLRSKPDSSMRVALNLVREGKAQACVSSGNTGALLALSRSILKTLPGIARPAIAAQVPNQIGGGTLVLDLGANVDCSASDYLQFAVMGTALMSVLEEKTHPSVGLLNIGEEEIKGNGVVKRAAELLRESRLNFYGNVEGHDIYAGTTDVVVCDGFVGNIALKVSEGLSRMILAIGKQEYGRNWLTRIAALLSMPVLNRFRKRLDARVYNGAVLLGLRGIVVKSHGSADVVGFESALRRAFEAVQNGLIHRTEQVIKNMCQSDDFSRVASCRAAES